MSKRTKKAEKGSWVVRVRVEAEKNLICSDCTEEEARTSPYDHCIDEEEVQQYDYKVINVSPND